MAIYEDRCCQWCKRVLLVAFSEKEHKAISDYVEQDGQVYCPKCYEDLVQMTRFVRGEL